MYAIIQTGSKQYRVEKGSRLRVEKLLHEQGKDFQIPEVLLVAGNGSGASIGRPYVEGSKVTATVIKHLSGPKLIIFKKRSKKGYKKKTGHRQDLTEIEIKEVA